MAKKPTAKTPAATAAVAITLAMIVAAGENGMFTPAEVHAPMVADGTVELNAASVDAQGWIATRATQKGIELVNAPQTTQTAAAVKSAFAIDDAIAMPTGTARGKHSATYPFDALGVGQSFFVPNTAERPDAAKSMASTVSSATARYAVAVLNPDGSEKTEVVKVPVYQLDAEGKRAKDGEGKLIKTGEKEETRVVTQETRKFVVRAFTNPDGTEGARIWRTA